MDVGFGRCLTDNPKSLPYAASKLTGSYKLTFPIWLSTDTLNQQNYREYETCISLLVHARTLYDITEWPLQLGRFNGYAGIKTWCLSPLSHDIVTYFGHEKCLSLHDKCEESYGKNLALYSQELTLSVHTWKSWTKSTFRHLTTDYILSRNASFYFFFFTPNWCDLWSKKLLKNHFSEIYCLVW